MKHGLLEPGCCQNSESLPSFNFTSRNLPGKTISINGRTSWLERTIHIREVPGSGPDHFPFARFPRHEVLNIAVIFGETKKLYFFVMAGILPMLRPLWHPALQPLLHNAGIFPCR